MRSIVVTQVDDQIHDLSLFLNFPELRHLDLYDGSFGADLSTLRRLPHLTSLSLPGLKEVTDFTPLMSQPSLKSLHITGCRNLENLEAIQHLTNLKSLTLGGASLTEGSIEMIAKLWPRLTLLQIIDAPWLTSIAPIATLPLEIITINGCDNLGDIDPIARLSRVKKLFLFDNKFIDLRPVGTLGRLAKINLGGTGRKIDLSPLASLPQLKSIYLLNVSEDTDLSALGTMRNSTITIDGCRSIRGISRLHRSVRVDWQ